MKKIILIIAVALIFIVVFIIGCAQQQETTTEKPTASEPPKVKGTEPTITEPSEIPQPTVQEKEESPLEEEKPKQEKTKETLPKNPLNVPRVNTAADMKIADGIEEKDWEGISEEESVPALCYLGAFGMLVIFDDPGLDISDVIAYSGVGSYAKSDSKIGLSNGYKEKSVILAAKNLDYDYVVGVKSGGNANSFMADFTSSASKVIYTKNEEEALNKLKEIIDSGKPVEVHLDIYYVRDIFGKSSNFWISGWNKMHASHFMVVTGYDTNYVYINDPTEPNLNIKNMKTPIKDFLGAWENGANPQIMGARLGPYWMLYINKKGIKKSVKDIVAWNKEISQNAASQIRGASGGDNGELGVGRREFGKFLENNGYKDASKLYQETADIYFTDPEDSQSYKEISEKEEQARALLE